jgi:peptidoglycan/xylan/chitin deacetylase (PgdA/CDA1 family)
VTRTPNNAHLLEPAALHPDSELRNWRPAVLAGATAASHLGAGAAVLAEPQTWPWAVGAVIANHAFITASGLWPRSQWLGDNLLRLPAAAAERQEISLTIDDGPDPEVTPAVLDVLEAHRARATFFCIADHAQRQPALCREILARGHSIQNHTQRHSHRFSLMGMKAFESEIGRAQQTLADITGEMPRYFRAPAGLRNPFLAPVLRRLDLRLVSWTRRGFDTVQTQPVRVLDKLTRALRAGDILLLHDGNAARTREGQAVVLAVLPPLLDRLAQSGLRTVTLPQALRAEALA